MKINADEYMNYALCPISVRVYFAVAVADVAETEPQGITLHTELSDVRYT